MNQTQRNGAMLLVLVLIGMNMRPLLTSPGPLLPQIQQASGMSFTLASLLTALPVIAMGLLALAGGWINSRFSERQSIAFSLLIIAAGALLRELAPQSALLLSSALLGGIGIGIIQALIPAVIKRLFHRPDASGDGTLVSGADGRWRSGSRIYAVAGAAQRYLVSRACVVGATRSDSAPLLVAAKQNVTCPDAIDNTALCFSPSSSVDT